jgi:hypothetical protein
MAPMALAPGALSCGLDLLARAVARVDAQALFLMEVEEAGNPRRSFDLNVYQAEFNLCDIADLVRTVAARFTIAPPRLGDVLDRCGPLALGHLSGGVDRDEREFVTVYYGVEAH